MKNSIALIAFTLLFSYKALAQKTNIEPQGPPENSIFPKFSYETIDGVSISSENLKNKIVVVNIWFVGCKGCKQEEPYLKKVTEYYEGDDDVIFLGLCMSKPDRINEYLEKNGEIGYSNISIDRKEVEENYKVRMSPTHFLIKNGVLMVKYTGPITPAGNKLQWFSEEIQKLKN